MAASLLNAIGLSDLITYTDESFEELAVLLATQPEKLSAFKARLAINRKTHALFDTERFTKNLESAFMQLIE